MYNETDVETRHPMRHRCWVCPASSSNRKLCLWPWNLSKSLDVNLRL